MNTTSTLFRLSSSSPFHSVTSSSPHPPQQVQGCGKEGSAAEPSKVKVKVKIKDEVKLKVKVHVEIEVKVMVKVRVKGEVKV